MSLHGIYIYIYREREREIRICKYMVIQETTFTRTTFVLRQSTLLRDVACDEYRGIADSVRHCTMY